MQKAYLLCFTCLFDNLFKNKNNSTKSKYAIKPGYRNLYVCNFLPCYLELSWYIKNINNFWIKIIRLSSMVVAGHQPETLHLFSSLAISVVDLYRSSRVCSERCLCRSGSVLVPTDFAERSHINTRVCINMRAYYAHTTDYWRACQFHMVNI